VKKLIDDTTDNKWTQQTLQSLLNRLIAKAFLKKDKRGKEYIYTPLVNEKDYVEFESSEFLRKMHGNSVVGLMRALFDSRQISEDDIYELEEMLKDKK